MAEAKRPLPPFTSGPMTVTREVNEEGEAQHTIRNEFGVPLAVLSNYWPREQLANATLFAAAPQLLEALILARREMRAMAAACGEGLMTQTSISAADAAIAKALGSAA